MERLILDPSYKRSGTPDACHRILGRPKLNRQEVLAEPSENHAELFLPRRSPFFTLIRLSRAAIPLGFAKPIPFSQGRPWSHRGLDRPETTSVPGRAHASQTEVQKRSGPVAGFDRAILKSSIA
jgi:hypothetical protein